MQDLAAANCRILARRGHWLSWTTIGRVQEDLTNKTLINEGTEPSSPMQAAGGSLTSAVLLEGQGCCGFRDVQCFGIFRVFGLGFQGFRVRLLGPMALKPKPVPGTLP